MEWKPTKHLSGKGKWFLLGLALVLVSVIYLLGRSIHQSLPPKARNVHQDKRTIPPPQERPKPLFTSPTPIVTGPEKEAQASVIVDNYPERLKPPLTSPSPIITKPEKKALISIIVDDLGNQYSPVLELIWIDFPLTMAVLPFRPFTMKIAEEVLASGKDLMLHLPMEPWRYPYQNPGEGTLLASMAPEEVLNQLRKAIQTLPGLKGINNHMGSRFMEDYKLVAVVIEEIDRQGLFFVDSLTTRRSKGPHFSTLYSLPILSRDIYLDNDQDPESIRMCFGELIAIAKATGKAIGICHPHPETISVLKELLPRLEKEGIELVPISDLVKDSS